MHIFVPGFPSLSLTNISSVVVEEVRPTAPPATTSPALREAEKGDG